MKIEAINFACGKDLVNCVICSLFIVALYSLSYIAPDKPMTDGYLAVLVFSTAFVIMYRAYWVRFYYKMYFLTSVSFPIPTETVGGVVTSMDMCSIYIAHRETILRERTTLRDEPDFRGQANAYLVGDDIVVVARGNETHDQIREVVKRDRILNGIRWCNNFSLSKGTKGFVSNGNFFEDGKSKQKVIRPAGRKPHDTNTAQVK